jgi:hypothetical protein
MVTRSIIDQFTGAGKSLILLDGRKPIQKEWQTLKVSRETLYSHPGNLGWSLSISDMVIDVDPRNGGDDSWRSLSQLLQITSLIPTVATPRGGTHYYLKIPKEWENKIFKKTLNNEYPGIDFLKRGNCCLIPSCTAFDKQYEWYDTLLDGFYQQEAPEALLGYIERKTKIESSSEDTSNPFLDSYQPSITSTWPRSKVEALLEHLDPSMGHDDWYKVGMALYDWNLSEEQGLELWESWSKKGENYQPNITKLKWRSFKPKQGVSMGTLLYMVRDADFSKEFELVHDIKAKILRSTEERVLIKDIPQELARNQFSPYARQRLIEQLRIRIKDVTGIKPTMSAINSLCVANTSPNQQNFNSRPQWTEEFVYIENADQYMVLETRELLNKTSFQHRYGSLVPCSDPLSRPMVDSYLKMTGYCDTVPRLSFLPFCDDAIVSLHGERFANSFNRDKMAKPSRHFTSKGKENIAIFKDHILMICNENETHANIIISWIAHQVQYPGVKMYWCPLIKSAPGLGKTILRMLMQNLLAPEYVNEVKSDTLSTRFNRWCYGAIVNVLEEVYIKGHNRYEAMDRLKPLITDPYVQMEGKAKDPIRVHNVTNYICFTNHSRSVALQDDDRRYFVIFNEMKDIPRDIKNRTGLEETEYFKRIETAFKEEEHDHQILKYLLELDLTAFKTIKRAPDTAYKRSMVAVEASTREGYENTKELIKEGGEGYDVNVVIGSRLWQTYKDRFMIEEDCRFLDSPKTKAAIMSDLGFIHHGRMHIQDKWETVYTSRVIPDSFVKDYLSGKLKYIVDF